MEALTIIVIIIFAAAFYFLTEKQPRVHESEPTKTDQTPLDNALSTIEKLQVEIHKLSALNSYLHQENTGNKDAAGKLEKLENLRRNLQAKLEVAEAANTTLEMSCRDLQSKLDAEIASRNTQSSASRGSNNMDKFTAAKRRFATLYHPNSMKHTGMDKIVREEFFKEFWRELEAIERAN